MKAALLDQLAKGPATMGELQRALGIPTKPGNRRGALLLLLRNLSATGHVRQRATGALRYELLAKSFDKP
jgi:hypothetical protein